MPSGHITLRLKYALLILCLLLSACKVELYSGLKEKEANEMLAILMAQGLSAHKESQKKENQVTLFVAERDLSQAIMLLNKKGFPRERFTSVGDIFEKDGLISSPLEERARYVYGLSQELSNTLSQLDGVLTARVHIVQPDQDKKGKGEASASVFIKYTEGSNLEEFIPKIKMLVANSIEGLDYENIAVALFPSAAVEEGAAPVAGSGLALAMGAESGFSLYSVLALLLVLIAVISYIAVKLRAENKKLQKQQPSASTSAP